MKRKRKYYRKKIGHAGTLDPFANGVLILAFGRYTKLFFLFDDMPKEYIALGVFGEMRDTDDIEGNIIKKSDINNKLSFEELEKIIKKILKEIFCRNLLYTVLKKLMEKELMIWQEIIKVFN
ncbi:hypothetical protein [Brachyspira murdochii]|uniref:hypothetical protein n=1 Tax=Brachyspira murdochii TaxID=84378 RepID=UPI0028006DFE|nr:hypothetical protein [Brachyspira murdochii]